MEPKDLLVTLYARLKVMDEKLSALEGRVADDEWRDS